MIVIIYALSSRNFDVLVQKPLYLTTYANQSGLTELTAYPFANSWKTSEVCADAEKSEQTPCEKAPLRRSFAETMCG